MLSDFQDLVLICSHEPWIEEVANLGEHASDGPEHEDFSDR